MRILRSLKSVLLIVLLSCTKGQEAKSEVLPIDVPETESFHLPKVPLCPPEMIEVEGNFCPDVQETCVLWDETVTNVNGKVRCLQFATTKCLSSSRKYLHYCIDKFEYQKDKSDPLPTVMISYNEAVVFAAKESKRVCLDYEWEFACAGENMQPYANGFVRTPDKCNIDKPWIAFDEKKLGSSNPEVRETEAHRLDQRVAVDANPECLSPFGVYGMEGNVDEILTNTHVNVKHKNTLMGGAWLKGNRTRCSARTDAHNEMFGFYQLGTRLCKNTDH